MAQSFLNANSVQVGVGSSSMLGDLGGSDGIGTHFVRDFDVQSTRFCVSAAADWSLSKYFGYRTSISYIYLSADDKYSTELSRRARNLTVNTSVVEIIPTLKYTFFSTERNRFRKWSHTNFSYMYLTVGSGLIFFSPTTTYNGQTYDLKSLGTEGQGLTGGAKNYSRLSVVVPLGIGFRQDLSRKSSLFFELTARKSFTDYLDDVSTVYYDNESLAASKGKDAAAVADRNTTGNKFRSGTKRGNPGRNDSYFTFIFGYSRSLDWIGKRRI